MPPKKTIEVAPPPEVPDQPPTFETDTFVDALLLMAKKRELSSLEEGVAAALGMADDFRINLRNGVVVDYTVECVLLASQLNFSARKTASFVKWMSSIRVCIETTGDVDKAKDIFRQHIIHHAERGALAANSPPPVPEEPSNADSATNKSAKASSSSAAGAKASGISKTANSISSSKAAQDAAAESSAVLLSLGDMGPVADFVVTGVLQHWRLYHHVANQDIGKSVTAAHTIVIQTPMAALPLARALPADRYEAQRDASRRRAEEELMALRKEEEERLAEEQRLEEIRAEEARLAEEEAKANNIFLSKNGTENIAAKVHDDVQAELLAKQAAVVARIARLEQLLHLPGM